MNCSAKRKEPQKMSSAVTEKGGYSHLAWLLGDLFFTMYRAWCRCANDVFGLGRNTPMRTYRETVECVEYI